MKKGYIQLMLSGRTVSLLSVHPGIEPQVVQKKLEEFPASSKSNGGKIFILAIDNAKVGFAFACFCRVYRHSERSSPHRLHTTGAPGYCYEDVGIFPFFDE